MNKPLLTQGEDLCAYDRDGYLEILRKSSESKHLDDILIGTPVSSTVLIRDPLNGAVLPDLYEVQLPTLFERDEAALEGVPLPFNIR